MKKQSRDFITCIHEAEKLFHRGQRKLATEQLEAALQDLKQPMQRLPAWLVEGVEVRWTGSPPNHVYKIYHVDRSKPDWRFLGERVLPGGRTSLIQVLREAGKFQWERYRSTTPNKQISQPTLPQPRKVG